MKIMLNIVILFGSLLTKLNNPRNGIRVSCLISEYTLYCKNMYFVIRVERRKFRKGKKNWNILTLVELKTRDSRRPALGQTSFPALYASNRESSSRRRRSAAVTLLELAPARACASFTNSSNFHALGRQIRSPRSEAWRLY